MHDALEDLSDLSLALQRSDITLPVAHKLISKQVEVFLSRRECDSYFYKEACQAVADGKFKDIVVSSGTGKEKEISKVQFYQALSDSMAARLLPESERALCSSVAVLDSSTWPFEMSPENGESDLRLLYEKFCMPYSELKMSFRCFRDSGGTVKSHTLQSLCNRVKTIPISTAECERGISKMNIVCSSLRSRLTVEHLSSLMFISLCGPPVRLWLPLTYVKSWLDSNHRDATSSQGPQKQVETVTGTRNKEMQSV